MKFIYSALMILYGLQAFGQRAILYPLRNTAEWPKANIFSLYVPNMPCKDILVKTNNGSVEQDGCYVHFFPDTIKPSKIFVYRRTGKRQVCIDSIYIRIKPNRVVVRIGLKTDEPITKNELLKFGGVIVMDFFTEGHAESASLKAYRITCFRSDTIESNINIGPRFTETSFAMLEKLQAGDKLLISEIKAIGFGLEKAHIPPAEFDIE